MSNVAQPTFLKNIDLGYLRDSLAISGIVDAEMFTVDHGKDKTHLFETPAAPNMRCVAFARVRMDKYRYLYITQKGIE